MSRPLQEWQKKGVLEEATLKFLVWEYAFRNIALINCCLDRAMTCAFRIRKSRLKVESAGHDYILVSRTRTTKHYLLHATNGHKSEFKSFCFVWTCIGGCQRIHHFQRYYQDQRGNPRFLFCVLRQEAMNGISTKQFNNNRSKHTESPSFFFLIHH
jgi:hypothetical protein